MKFTSSSDEACRESCRGTSTSRRSSTGRGWGWVTTSGDGGWGVVLGGEAGRSSTPATKRPLICSLSSPKPWAPEVYQQVSPPSPSNIGW